jgi:DNA-binding LacI/PurR family transcriptional regulator
MLTTDFRRLPEPGLFERAFLDELETLGIPTGLYNLPDWEENTEGYHNNLESLFRFTPPTALFVDRALFIPPTLQFCMRNGLQVPQDFSLICTESDPSFDWTQPSIAHIHRDNAPITRRMVQWAEQPPIFPMTAPPNTSLKKQIPSSRSRAG